MTYLEDIQQIIKDIPASIIDFSTERRRASRPTQATSNFITNKEQGDWAENLIFKAINETSKNYVAVKYGKSDDIIAGEESFADFYDDFQNELDTIGKRPDLLIFKKDDFDENLGYDISRLPHSEINEYVKKAVAGLEIRSSAFLVNKYEAEMHERTQFHLRKIFEIRDKILNEYKDILETKKPSYIPLLESISEENVFIMSFRRPTWRATDRLQELSRLFKELKEHLKIIQKRDYLSITPKVEDLKVVYKWIETFNVPHYYFQVFFDKAYGISFKQILQLLTQPEKEGEFYTIEQDEKNQNKTTIKINTRKTTLIASKIDEPEHESKRRELARGRLLFYVTFKGGAAYLDIDNLKSLLHLHDF